MVIYIYNKRIVGTGQTGSERKAAREVAAVVQMPVDSGAPFDEPFDRLRDPSD